MQEKVEEYPLGLKLHLNAACSRLDLWTSALA